MKTLFKLNRKDKRYKQRTANTVLAKMAVQCSADQPRLMVNHPARQIPHQSAIWRMVKIAIFAKPETFSCNVNKH
ncbi:MAG: hypothetical protein ACK47E_08450 [Cyclobacteriaceae bacterium]